MSKKAPKLRVLAKTSRSETLCTTEKQDEYFVVTTNGRHRKVSVLQAVRLYLRASKDETNLVWKRKRRKPAKAPKADKTPEQVAHVDRWVRKLDKVQKARAQERAPSAQSSR